MQNRVFFMEVTEPKENPSSYSETQETQNLNLKDLYQYGLQMNPNSKSRFRIAASAWREGVRRVAASDKEGRHRKQRGLYATLRIPYYILSVFTELPYTCLASYRYLKYNKPEKRYHLRDGRD